MVAGHRPGDPADMVGREVRVRADSAGCTAFVDGCRARNIGFSVVARRTEAIHAAILATSTDEDAWHLRSAPTGRPVTTPRSPS